MSLFWNKYSRNLVLQFVPFFPIRKNQVLCLCWSGTYYNCNPRAIVERMSEMGLLTDTSRKFNVFFAFLQPQKYQDIMPEGVHAVMLGSYDYYRLLATSRFIISNTHFGGESIWPFPKRKGQIYIQTMHGGHGIKKIEHDAILSDWYVKMMIEDTSRIDLMLSDSVYLTQLYRSAFKYSGEVLEYGLPRNDIFFQPRTQLLGEKRYLVYAPTFRNNGRRDVYGFDVDTIISALEKRFGGEWYIRVSSHPNMRGYYKSIYDFSHPRLIDIGGQDLQEYLPESDALITDYSSSEMDFSLTGRPVLQLCIDRHDYDRGFYIQPEELPFPYAEKEEELVRNILTFDEEKYKRDLEKFNRDTIGLKETGHASDFVVRWMLQHITD